MQKFTQKYAIIQLFENIPEGTDFSWKEWPLHSTIADVFAIDWNSAEMADALQHSLAKHPTAQSTVLDDTFFGPNQETRVVLLEKTKSLLKLHNDVLDILAKGGYKANNPEFAREGFLPHSTVQKHARLQKGDIVTFDTLSIIDMFPNEDPYQRKVLATIPIGRSK
jgi:2'-5' RNA ligase